MNTIEFIKSEKIWCNWKRNNNSKTPFSPIEGITYSGENYNKMFQSYDDAVNNNYKKDGIGFKRIDGIAVIDMDDCFNEGKLSNMALETVNLFSDCYIEKSPSENGLHIILQVSPNFIYDKEKYLIKTKNMEIYSGSSNGYMTFTGNELLLNPSENAGNFDNDVEERLRKLMDKYMKKESVEELAINLFDDTPKTELDAESILKIISNSKEESQINAMKYMNNEFICGNEYPSDSEYVMFIISALVFYTQSDDTVWEIFSNSELGKSRSEKKLQADKRTIKTARENQKKMYAPKPKIALVQNTNSQDALLTGSTTKVAKNQKNIKSFPASKICIYRPMLTEVKKIKHQGYSVVLEALLLMSFAICENVASKKKAQKKLSGAPNFYTTKDDLARRMNLTKKKLEILLIFFKEIGYIDYTSVNGKMYISLLKFNEYIEKGDYDGLKRKYRGINNSAYKSIGFFYVPDTFFDFFYGDTIDKYKGTEFSHRLPDFFLYFYYTSCYNKDNMPDELKKVFVATKFDEKTEKTSYLTSVYEVAKKLNLSNETAKGYIKSLEKSNFLRRTGVGRNGSVITLFDCVSGLKISDLTKNKHSIAHNYILEKMKENGCKYNNAA